MNCLCKWDNAWLLSRDKTLQPPDPHLFPSAPRSWFFGLASTDFTSSCGFPQPWVLQKHWLVGDLVQPLAVSGITPGRRWGQPWLSPGNLQRQRFPTLHPPPGSAFFMSIQPGSPQPPSPGLAPPRVTWNCQEKVSSLIFLTTLRVILPYVHSLQQRLQYSILDYTPQAVTANLQWNAISNCRQGTPAEVLLLPHTSLFLPSCLLACVGGLLISDSQTHLLGAHPLYGSVILNLLKDHPENIFQDVQARKMGFCTHVIHRPSLALTKIMAFYI